MGEWLLVGLGNPGEKYRATRHNVGFRAVEAWAAAEAVAWREEKRWEAEVATVTHRGGKIVLIKPQTYMNASGRAVGKAMRYLKLPLDRVVAIADEVQFATGTWKLSIGGGDGGHNGIADIRQHVGSEFARLRLGVGPKTEPRMTLTDFVLGRFTAAEEETVVAALPKVVEALKVIVDKGPALAMNQINQRAKTPTHA